MEVIIRIDDPAINRLTWKELRETVEKEYETSQAETLRVLKTARQRFGLEVDDGTSGPEQV